MKAAGWKVAYDPAVLVDHYEEITTVASARRGCREAEHRDAVHNQTYALLKHLPLGRRLTAFAYGLLVGARDNPGVLLAIERVFSGRSPATSGLPGRFRGPPQRRQDLVALATLASLVRARSL